MTYNSIEVRRKCKGQTMKSFLNKFHFPRDNPMQPKLSTLRKTKTL